MPDLYTDGIVSEFVPILFTKPDGSQAIANSPAEYIALEFEGWTPSGVIPNQVIVQPQRPSFVGAYMWVQTGLGEDGTGFTIWIEDGQ